MTKEQVNLAIESYDELVAFVNNYEGEFSALRKELEGIENDFGTFIIAYKSIVAEVYLNLGTYFVSGDLIVFDDEGGVMKRISINELKNMKKFELSVYNGMGGVNKHYFDHLNDALDYMKLLIDEDEEMSSQFNLYYVFDNGNGRDVRDITATAYLFLKFGY